MQQYFNPPESAWVRPLPPPSSGGRLAMRRLRWLAVLPVCVCVWSVAAMAKQGFLPERVGALIAGLVLSTALLQTSTKPTSTFAESQQLVLALTVFVIALLSSVPLLTYTTSLKCNVRCPLLTRFNG